MKYALIWMLSLGLACGLADEEGAKAINENPVAALLFAPAVAVIAVVDTLRN